jgi:RNA polymerase sigma-70 factor (ECF subfamily)
LRRRKELKLVATGSLPACFPAPSDVTDRFSAEEFRSLVEAHQSRVYSIAFRILGDSGLAEEVAQDVFLALSRNLDRIENGEHLLAWVRRVAVQRATDACRRRSSRVDFAAAEFHEERTIARHEQSSATSRNHATKVERLVASLPHPQRAIVLLRYQEDLTPAEIAAALEMPVATVKSHLQRTLKLLRKKMERENKELVHDRSE